MSTAPVLSDATNQPVTTLPSMQSRQQVRARLRREIQADLRHFSLADKSTGIPLPRQRRLKRALARRAAAQVWRDKSWEKET